MNERELSILDAAQSVFAKYGVSKTTMSDIAEAAGVARQTVYNAFATKNDILRAAVRVETERSIAEVRAAWEVASTLEERIEIFHKFGPLRWYQMVEDHPDLADLWEGLHHIAAEEIHKGKLAWLEMFVQMFERQDVTPVDPGLTHKDLADFLYSTGKHAKFETDSFEHMKRRLHICKVAMLNLVQD
ncbi:TetR/AcrR family transcriptional regulator [Cognatishimia sp.]|uniref:TetR/AcrR family transcriptional regulator n=1 Tax=Cognatishimia sp. TaxID=2211648 RepID=UPI00351103DC